MSARPITNLTDAELEAHILDCGRLFLKAHAEGDMPGAARWLKAQTDAVNSRSPEQVARMESEYFGYEGEKALFAAQQRMAG